ncbi:MAG: hypothetical protein IPK10_03400 [Bacteroidetes bacterium]|nr:hypothetical protein [Bacteroidota bacterium]
MINSRFAKEQKINYYENKIGIVVAMVLCTGGLFAQTTEKKSLEKNTVKVHIEKVVDGKKPSLTLTFTSTDDMLIKLLWMSMK